jgi:endonuclease YncB( thermonuclease family)
MRRWWVRALLVGLVATGVKPVAAEPLGPPEAAQLAARILEGHVWVVHAVVVRVIDGDSVVLNLDLGWQTWRANESVRLAHVDAPERRDQARWAAAKAFVERLLPAGT